MKIETLLKKFDALSFGLGIVIAFIGLILFQLASNEKMVVNVEAVRLALNPSSVEVNEPPTAPPSRRKTPNGAQDARKPSGSKTVAEARMSSGAHEPKKGPAPPKR